MHASRMMTDGLATSKLLRNHENVACIALPALPLSSQHRAALSRLLCLTAAYITSAPGIPLAVCLRWGKRHQLSTNTLSLRLVMTDGDDQDTRKRLRAAENLGWLAESGTYSKKRKLIEGAALQDS